MIKALIICDETEFSEALLQQIGQHCPQVSVPAVCNSYADATSAISLHNPQLLFLHIELPQMNGFAFLEQIPVNDFQVIFTSHNDHYAVRAIHFNALGYLVYPIDSRELQMAVGKVGERSQRLITQQLDSLVQRFNHPATPVQKVALPTQQGLQMVHADSIISCASDSNYSILNLKGKQKIVVSRTLKEIEEMLQDFAFVRVHHSFLVNLNEVEKYIKGEGGFLIMSDGTQIDVSRSRKDILIQKLLHLKP